MATPARPPQQTTRQLRLARGWTQLDLAMRLRVNLGSVSAWERGLSVPRRITQQRLANLFGVEVGEITFGQDEEQP